MNDYINEIEELTYIERRYGLLTKTIGQNPSNEKLSTVERTLVEFLEKYKKELAIVTPLPRIRAWLVDNKINFIFFDRRTGRRILLGEWLSNREQYEH
jgi:hypothetical protein